jgi:hypothetical protein
VTKMLVGQQHGISGARISLPESENNAQGDNVLIGGSRPTADSQLGSRDTEGAQSRLRRPRRSRNIEFQRALAYHTDTGGGPPGPTRAADSITPLSFVVDGKQNSSFLARGHRPKLGAVSNNTLRAVARRLREQGIDASFNPTGLIQVDCGGLILRFRSANESYSVDVRAGVGVEWALSSPFLSVCDDVATVLAATMALIEKHTLQ